MSEVASLWALFGSAFLSATVLPLPSEGALVAFAHAYPESVKAAVFVATFGNTLGGITTYLLGRFSGRYLPKQGYFAPQVLQAFERFGPFSLIFSWVPLIGDMFCAIAGWLGLPFWRCVFWMALGKGLRYSIVGLAYNALAN